MQSVQKDTIKQLRVWDRVQILVGEGAERGEYDARVEDIINGGIIITWPDFIRGHTLLREGTTVTVVFAGDDAAYQFASQIRQHSASGRRQMVLTPPGRIRRLQRRLFCRIETNSNVAYAIIKPMMDWEDWEDRLTWTNSRCVDISGGGALIRAQDQIVVGTHLLMRLAFFHRHSLPKEVVAVCRRTLAVDGDQCAGVEFILADQLTRVMKREDVKRLPDSVRHFGVVAQNKLVSCIFAEQIELRKKGLL